MKHLLTFIFLFSAFSLWGQLPEGNIEHSYNKRGAYLPQGIAGFQDTLYFIMSWKRFNGDGSERPGDRGTPIWVHADSLKAAGIFGGGGPMANGIISALPLGSVAINADDNNFNITELGSLSFSTFTDTTAGAVQSRVLAGSFSSIPTGLRRIQADTAKVEMLGDALILQDSSGKYAAHNFNQAYLFATGGFQSGTLTGVSKRMLLSDATGYKAGAQTGDVDVETAWEADTDSTFTLRSGTWRVEYNLRGRVDLDSASIVNASLQIATTNIPSVSQFYYYGDSAKPIAAKEYCTLSGFTVVSIPAGETRLLSLRVSVAPMASAAYEFDRANIIATRIGKP